jgi:hypothetical protein
MFWRYIIHPLQRAFVRDWTLIDRVLPEYQDTILSTRQLAPDPLGYIVILPFHDYKIIYNMKTRALRLSKTIDMDDAGRITFSISPFTLDDTGFQSPYVSLARSVISKWIENIWNDGIQ